MIGIRGGRLDKDGFPPALEAVLREVSESGAERIIFLGDIVGYGASPAEKARVGLLALQMTTGFPVKKIHRKAHGGNLANRASR